MLLKWQADRESMKPYVGIFLLFNKPHFIFNEGELIGMIPERKVVKKYHGFFFGFGSHLK